MGQEDVIKVLEKSDIGLSAKDIAELLEISSRAVRKALQSLVEYHEVVMAGNKPDIKRTCPLYKIISKDLKKQKKY